MIAIAQVFRIHLNVQSVLRLVLNLKQKVRNVIAKCRKEGIQVCWLNWGITDHDLKVMPPAVTRGFNRALAHEKGHGWHVGLGAMLPPEQGGERCLLQGTWNADIYDPLKADVTENDVRFDKSTASRQNGVF